MNRLYQPFLVLVLIGSLLLVAGRWQLTRPLVNAIQFITEPVIAAETQGVRRSLNLFTLIASIKDLHKENKMLRTKVADLEAELTQLKEVRHENEVLRQELQFTQDTKEEYLPAQVIGRSATGLVKDLIIDRGSADGITAGQAVVAQGHLVGLVEQVEARQATVSLIDHPRSLVPVILQDSRASGILRGGISGLTATDILIDADIKSGETVVTSGLGGTLPAGIPVGKAIEIIARKGDITKRTTVRSPIDVNRLELIFIRKVDRD